MTAIMRAPRSRPGPVADLAFVALLIAFGRSCHVAAAHLAPDPTWRPRPGIGDPGGVLLKLGGYASSLTSRCFRAPEGHVLAPPSTDQSRSSTAPWSASPQDDLKRPRRVLERKPYGIVTSGSPRGVRFHAAEATDAAPVLGFSGPSSRCSPRARLAALMSPDPWDTRFGTRNISEPRRHREARPVDGDVMVVSFMASLGSRGLVGFVAEFAPSSSASMRPSAPGLRSRSSRRPHGGVLHLGDAAGHLRTHEPRWSRCPTAIGSRSLPRGPDGVLALFGILPILVFNFLSTGPRGSSRL